MQTNFFKLPGTPAGLMWTLLHEPHKCKWRRSINNEGIHSGSWTLCENTTGEYSSARHYHVASTQSSAAKSRNVLLMCTWRFNSDVGGELECVRASAPHSPTQREPLPSCSSGGLDQTAVPPRWTELTLFWKRHAQHIVQRSLSLSAGFCQAGRTKDTGNTQHWHRQPQWGTAHTPPHLSRGLGVVWT